jgi:hypothetical protein
MGEMVCASAPSIIAIGERTVFPGWHVPTYWMVVTSKHVNKWALGVGDAQAGPNRPMMIAVSPSLRSLCACCGALTPSPSSPPHIQETQERAPHTLGSIPWAQVSTAAEWRRGPSPTTWWGNTPIQEKMEVSPATQPHQAQGPPRRKVRNRPGLCGLDRPRNHQWDHQQPATRSPSARWMDDAERARNSEMKS